MASALAIFIKWSSRNDRLARFTKEDCAIGLELAVTGIFALIVAVPLMASTPPQLADSSERPEDLVAVTLLLVFVFTIGLWVVSTIVRKIGWISAHTLRWFPGLIVPLIYGLAVMLITTLWIVYGT